MELQIIYNKIRFVIIQIKIQSRPNLSHLSRGLCFYVLSELINECSDASAKGTKGAKFTF